jgi:DNA mismatch endonuclease (patch repair protein)
VPSRNRLFWLSKFRDNRRRDERMILELKRAGFTVVTVWECEVSKPLVLGRALSRVVRAADRARSR